LSQQDARTPDSPFVAKRFPFKPEVLAKRRRSRRPDCRFGNERFEEIKEYSADQPAFFLVPENISAVT